MIEEIDPPDHDIIFYREWLVSVGDKVGLAYMSVQELKAVCYFAHICGGNVVEIGCNEGYSTAPLAANLSDRTVYGVDYDRSWELMHPKQHKECPKEIGRIASGFTNVIILNIDSRSLDYSGLENVRMIFIDGGHQYSQVKSDSEKAVAHLTQNGGGFILWHDYDRDAEWIDVKEYIDAELAPYHDMWRIKGTSLVGLEITT